MNPYSSSFLSAFLVCSLWGCGHHARLAENKWPLPPVSDSGLVDGEFLQVDYGFAFPVPAHWSLLRLSEDQEVDEVARISDPGHELIARVTVHLLDQGQAFSLKDWEGQCEQEQQDHQLDLVKKGKTDEWETGDGFAWNIQNYRVADKNKEAWLDQEAVLNRDDLLIWVHTSLDQATAESPKGQKLLKTLQAALSKTHWYMPIGERGISLELYELDHFTADFKDDLESRSTARLTPYFDDLYPQKPQWDAWYQQLVSDVPDKAELTAELSGLVINGEGATAVFTLTKKMKTGGPLQKFEKSFELSKKDGSWKIIAPAGKS